MMSEYHKGCLLLWALQLIDHFNLDQGKFMSFNWQDDAMPAGIES